MKKTNNIVTIFCLFTAFVFVASIYAIIFQVIGIDTSNKATIFSGVLSMIGGIVGALGAYFVATNQMNKQFEHEKKKEERQRKELIEQTLRKLELLNEDAIEFIDYFTKEFSKKFDEERIAKLKFSEKDLQWTVNNVNSINDEILMDGYALDYLKFSRTLNNMYIDVIGIDFIPENQKPNNLLYLIESMSKRREIFVSFEKYLKEHIEEIQLELKNLN